MRTFRILLAFIITGTFSLVTALENGFYCQEPSFLSTLNFIPEKCCKYIDGWTFDFEGGYTVGRFIGLDEGYAQIGAFISPPPLGVFQPLIDLKAYRLDDGYLAASLGGGVRWVENRFGNIVGANLFYDLRNTDLGLFNRVGLGLEYFANWFDYHLNVYLPFNFEKTGITHRDSDHSELVFRKLKYAFGGLDFLISRPLYTWNNFQFQGRVGPYYYAHKNVGHIFGGEATFVASWKKFIVLETSVSYDSKFKANIQGTLNLNVPFEELFADCPPPEETETLFQPIQRFGVIFVKHAEDWDHEKGKHWKQKLYDK